MSLPVGEAASLAAAACWAVGLTLFRHPVRRIGARPVNLFKGCVGTLLTVAVLLVAGTTPGSPRAQFMLLLSGVIGVSIGDTLLFHALGRIGAHRAALLQSIGPVLTVLGGWALGETLGPWRIAGILAAVAGVAIVVRFRRAGAGPDRADALGIVLGVLAAACQSAGVLLAKQGMQEADPMTASALRLAASTAVLALVAFARREMATDLKRLLRPEPLARMIPAALIGTFLALWLMQVGIQRTESAVANALHSTTPLFTLPIAVFVLRERYGRGAVLGSFLAVAGVVLLFVS